MNARVLHKRFRGQLGFTLTELMVGLTVSLILVAIIAQIYVGAKVSYRYQSELGAMQESGRFAMNLMAEDAKSAGFKGCGDVGVVANVLKNSSSSWWLDTSRPIRVFNDGTGFPADFSGVDVLSDAVAFIRTDSVSERMVTAHDPVSAALTVSSVPLFEKGDLLMVTDCQSTAFFQMTGPAPSSTNTSIEHKNTAGFTPGNCQNSLGFSCGLSGSTKQFAAGSLVSKIVSKGYFIAPATAPNTGNSLYMSFLTRAGQSVSTTQVEMVPGVEAMRVTYGIDDTGDLSANRFLHADDVNGLDADMTKALKRVVSLRVELLLHSQQNGLASETQTLTFDGAAWTAPDKRLYRVFTTTLNLRNHTS